MTDKDKMTTDERVARRRDHRELLRYLRLRNHTAKVQTEQIQGPGGSTTGSLCPKHGVPLVGTVTDEVLCAVCEKARAAEQKQEAIHRLCYAFATGRLIRANSKPEPEHIKGDDVRRIMRMGWQQADAELRLEDERQAREKAEAIINPDLRCESSDTGTFDYPAAARSIALNLSEWCDESLPYPQMIAEAARRAEDELARLRGVVDEISMHAKGALMDGDRDVMEGGLQEIEALTAPDAEAQPHPNSFQIRTTDAADTQAESKEVERGE